MQTPLEKWVHPAFGSKVLTDQLLFNPMPLFDVYPTCGPPYNMYDGVAFDLVGPKARLQDIQAAFDFGVSQRQ